MVVQENYKHHPKNLAGDTKILLSDGSYVNAEDIVDGDEIISWVDDLGKYMSTYNIQSKRERIVDKIYRITTESGKTIDVSESHGFYLTIFEEIKANEIVEGETRIWVKENNVKLLELVTSVEIIHGEDKVYSFSVPGPMNYISNGILSHNTIGTGPQQVTTNLSTTFSKSTTLNMTSGFKYYRIKRTYSAVANVGFSDNSDRLYKINTKMSGTLVFTGLTEGIEINSVGLQANSADEKVFRVDLSSTTDDVSVPFINVVGGMAIDYFEPKYSTPETLGETDKKYGESNTEIAYNTRSFPLTKFCVNLDNYDGTNVITSTMSSIGVASSVRQGEGYGYITLDDKHYKGLNVVMDGYRQTATMYNNESSFNSAVKYYAGGDNQGSQVDINYVYYATKDNDTNTDSDADSISIIGFG